MFFRIQNFSNQRNFCGGSKDELWQACKSAKKKQQRCHVNTANCPNAGAPNGSIESTFQFSVGQSPQLSTAASHAWGVVDMLRPLIGGSLLTDID